MTTDVETDFEKAEIKADFKLFAYKKHSWHEAGFKPYPLMSDDALFCQKTDCQN